MMENIQEIIDALSQNPIVIAIMSTIVTFIAANIGTIILFVIKYLALKKQEFKNKAENQAIIQALEAKYNDKLVALETHIDENMAKIEQHVVDKVTELEVQKEELVNSETVTIEAALKEAKEALRRE